MTIKWGESLVKNIMVTGQQSGYTQGESCFKGEKHSGLGRRRRRPLFPFKLVFEDGGILNDILRQRFEDVSLDKRRDGQGKQNNPSDTHNDSHD